MRLELFAHKERDLFDKDEQADGGQHAVDGRAGEQSTEAGHLELGEDDLQNAGEQNRHQHQWIALFQIAVTQRQTYRQKGPERDPPRDR